jgi:hypothetical protein
MDLTSGALAPAATSDATGAATGVATTGAAAAGVTAFFLEAATTEGATEGAAGAAGATGTSSDFFWTRLEGAEVGLLIVLDPVVIVDIFKRAMPYLPQKTTINFYIDPTGIISIYPKSAFFSLKSPKNTT